MKNKMTKISLIIPVFNQEEYVEECLQSIVNQSFKDFEAILVDDASTDKTFEIFNKKFAKDKRFRVISYKENKGTSQARKDAVLLSNGEFVMFVDPDDSLHIDALKIAYEAITKEKADMVQFGTNVVDCGVNPNALATFVRNCEPFNGKIKEETLFFKCFEEKLFNFNLWNKIYNGDMARQAFSYVKDGYYPKAQDFYGFVLMAFFSKSYASINDKLYNYYFGRGITGKRSISMDRFYKVSTQMHIIEQLYKFLDTQKPENINHYLEVLKYRGKIFFNEVYANFGYIENFDENKEEGLMLFLNGITPQTKVTDFSNKEIYNDYINTVYSYADELYYNKNLDCNQIVYNWVFENIKNNNMKTINSYLVKEITKIKDVLNTSKSVIPVVFATNDNYAPYLGVTIASIIEHTSAKNVYDLYVFHTSLSNQNQMKLKSMSTENVAVRCVNVMPYVKNLRNYSHSHYSIEMYYRILIPEILKQYKKTLYLDCDLVVNTDIDELYNIDLGKNILAGVINDITTDYMKSYLKQTLNLDTTEYFNSGVLVINNQEFIKNNIKEKCFETLNSFKKLMCPDQDILNLSCKDRILFLNNTWNFQVGSGAFSLNQKYLENHFIIHYTSGKKPWNTSGMELAEVFWKYAKKSPYYEDILSNYLSTTLKIQTKISSEQVSQEKQRNIINADHQKKSIASWPFRMAKKFFLNLQAIGFKRTMKKVNVKTKYAFGRIFGKVDKWNNPIIKNKSNQKTPFEKQKIKDYEYYKNLPVSKYSEELEKWYNEKTGSQMDINNPQTFNEKVQWLKIFDATLLKSHLSDKFLAKEYIKAVLGEKYIIKTLGIYEKFDDINFSVLPDRFVIKSTHGSGQVIIVKDKSKINKEEIKTKTEKWLKINFAYTCGLEVHYHNMIPRIIIEEYMENITDDLYDYKIMCINGRVELMWVDSNRFVQHQRNVYDKSWKPIHKEIGFPENPNGIPKPKCLKELLSLAERLSKGFACVRCDFYILADNTIKFGELTFTSGSGFADWKPHSYFDEYLGKKIILPIKSEFKKLSKKQIEKSEKEFLSSLKKEKTNE